MPADSVSPKPSLGVEVGVSHHLPFVSTYQNSWEVFREAEVSVSQLVAMRRMDGQARALYRLITLPIRAALQTATFVPAEHVQGGLKEAEFSERLFTLPVSAGGMKTPFRLVVAQMLMAIFDGFSAFEMVYQVPKTGLLKGKWTLDKIAVRPAETLTFLVDDRGEFDGFRQRVMWKGQYIDRPISRDTTFYYAANEEERPFYGLSYFESAFYHWDKKSKLYYIAHLAAQRSAVGTRVGTMPPSTGVTEKAAFKAALAELGVAQSMTVPEGFKVEGLREGTSFDFMSFIDHHNSQMSKSVLAAFFDSSQGGDNSLVDFGKQTDSMFILMLEAIMSDVAEVINTQIIPRFIDWNFNSGKYPTFRFGQLTADQKKLMKETFDKLSTAGSTVIATPEFVLELEKVVADEFGLEIDYDAIEEEMAEEKEQQKAQQDLFNQQQGGQDSAAGIPDGVVPPGFQL